MNGRWKIFGLTFLSYAGAHAAKTAWSSIKFALNSSPFQFSPMFLGTLDMSFLFAVAITINILGPKIQRIGPKRSLQIGLLGLAVIYLILSCLLLGQVTSKMPYIILYPLSGVVGSLCWPACIYILSSFFQKGMAFSVWCGCSQIGDFVALLISYWVVQNLQLNPGLLLLCITLLFIILIVLNKHFLHQQLQQNKQQINIPAASPAQPHKDNLIQQKQEHIAPPLSSDSIHQSQAVQEQLKPINMITVWTLPGVPVYIISFIFVRAVNAIVVTWLVFYLSMIGMVKQSRFIAGIWSFSIFFGGIFASYFNSKFKKSYFIISLFISAFSFAFLQQFHLYSDQFQVVILIILAGCTLGGPLTVLHTSIPIYLSQKPDIKKYPGAKSAIVSCMDGYSILICGIAIILIPTVGVIDLHWVALLLCLFSALVLAYSHFNQYKSHIKTIKNRTLSQPVIRYQRYMHEQLSFNNQKQQKRKRRHKTLNYIKEKKQQTIMVQHKNLNKLDRTTTGTSKDNQQNHNNRQKQSNIPKQSNVSKQSNFSKQVKNKTQMILQQKQIEAQSPVIIRGLSNQQNTQQDNIILKKGQHIKINTNLNDN